ncbi:MAG: pilus assembly protein PilM [Planctomycetes bacterium]|nr:pilus assembly protein PilM [Planctomycetota bacterium]
MAKRAVAVDPGSHTFKVLQLEDRKQGLVLTDFATCSVGDGGAGLSGTGIPLKGAVAGLAGRSMTLRYTQVPPAPDWQLRNLMELEIADLANQSGDALSADYNLLPPTVEESDSDTILMALARNEALDGVAELVAAAGGNVAGHVPNCIAVFNAYLRTYTTDEDEVVCIANIGHETIDIALAKGQNLLFARNLTGGGKVLDDAIGSAFNVGGRKAETLKKELLDLDPASRGKFASNQAEKVTMAAGGSASMLVSAIQSSLAFCKQQTRQPDLRLDRVLLCGGSARLRGIRGLMREALHCSVETFDPFASVDLSELSPAELEDLDSHRSEAVVALGLAATRLDDSLYSLEILPESVKRRQRFVQRTVFSIAAGVLLIGLLGYQAYVGIGDAQAGEDAKRSADREYARYAKVNKATAEVVAENEVRKELIEFLATKSVPLDGSLQVLRSLQALLPEDLWLDVVEVVPNKSAKGATKGQLIHVRGRGKEVSGKPINSVFQGFAAALKDKFKGIAEVKTPATPKGNEIQFDVFVDLLAGGAQPNGSDPEKAGGNGGSK